jgi:hypothetical protein
MNQASLQNFIFAWWFRDRPGAIPGEMPDLGLIPGVH